MRETPTRHRGRRWWSIGSVAIGVLAFAVVLWRIDYDRFREAIAGADAGYLPLVVLAIAAEQVVRAWKWRQLLYVIRPIGVLRLFGAIMAGYLVSFLIPFGVSPVVRSWLVARLEDLKTSAVLATAAVDRLVDGVVFTGFVVVALAFTAFPDPTGGIRLGLMVAGGGSLVLFAALLFGLARYKRHAGRSGNWVERLSRRLPSRFAGPTRTFMLSFAEGIVWPRSRSLGIVGASVLIKALATTNYLWAGLAFGVVLRPEEYVFILVLLGFLIILNRFARVPGGMILGSVFALELFGVAEERALAMTLVVIAASVATVSTIGAFALWKSGVALADLRAMGDARPTPAGALKGSKKGV